MQCKTFEIKLIKQNVISKKKNCKATEFLILQLMCLIIRCLSGFYFLLFLLIRNCNNNVHHIDGITDQVLIRSNESSPDEFMRFI